MDPIKIICKDWSNSTSTIRKRDSRKKKKIIVKSLRTESKIIHITYHISIQYLHL